jgi:predicted nuclease with TOPRIM domain
MLQFSKILRSRQDWKKKATQRANENRELRKIRKHHETRIAALKSELNEIKQETMDKKTP